MTITPFVVPGYGNPDDITPYKIYKENDEKIRELETLIKEGMPDPNEIAKNAIITETEFRLDEIYIRNFLKSVCQNGEEITDSDKRKLNQYFIRTEDKQQCGTLLDKLETIKSEANEEKKLEMLKETISLVVDDKERNNKDVLKSLREIARERFYGLDSENLNFKEMNKERNEYLDSIFPEDFKLNEDKIKELKEIFKQKGKIVEENLDLSSKENITKFVKKEFGESPNDFDDVVKKIAVFVKKNEIASSIIESPYFRISPIPVVSGGDSVGGGVTHVASGAQVGRVGDQSTPARTIHL